MVFLFILGILGAVGWYVYTRLFNQKPPEVDPTEWWGPAANKGKEDTSVRPFEVKFSDEMIQDLRSRLKNHRPLEPPLEGAAFRYGFNTETLNTWIKYWAEEYPFKQRETFLNQFPQYKTNIQGLDIHFIRVKPQVPSGVKVVPLLLVHGWPGSVREFYEAIPLLTQQAPGYDFAFEVIVPSLPGFGFSDTAVRPGLGPLQIAVIFKNLMTRLGFKKFYVQGGDWGSLIVANLSTLYQEDILGHHTNMPVVQSTLAKAITILCSVMPSLIVEPECKDRMYPLSKIMAYANQEFGYFRLQSTKPDSVGVALTDSPAGLLAYILEKFSTWTRVEHRDLQDGGLEFRFTKDKLIDNLMLYWSNNRITSSLRIYAEHELNSKRGMDLSKFSTVVPTWALQAKNEILYQPPSILKFKYKNLVGNTVLDDGGHFLAFELPEIYKNDLFKAFKKIMDWRKEQGLSEL